MGVAQRLTVCVTYDETVRRYFGQTRVARSGELSFADSQQSRQLKDQNQRLCLFALVDRCFRRDVGGGYGNPQLLRMPSGGWYE